MSSVLQISTFSAFVHWPTPLSFHLRKPFAQELPQKQREAQLDLPSFEVFFAQLQNKL
jgi:hypothetical protein